MPRRRLSVRTIREVLRLRWQCGLSEREISATCHISATAVRSYLQRAKGADLSWPLPEDLRDAQLERGLFPPPSRVGADVRPAINWSEVNKQLKHKGVTLHILSEEYRQSHLNGYCYSRYCKLYAAWLRTSADPVVLRFTRHDRAFRCERAAATALSHSTVR